MKNSLSNVPVWSSIFFQKNRPVLWMFCVVTVINFLFSYTYPINVAAYDYPNYLGMIHAGDSNLIHASGYPAIFRGLLDLFLIQNSETIMDVSWVTAIQQLHLFVHLLLLFVCTIICLQVFGVLPASFMCFAWGGNVLFLGGVNLAGPEWLQGELLVLSLLLSMYATSLTHSKKLFLYIFSAFVFTGAYLVKYNTLVMIPALLLIVLLDSCRSYFKILIIGLSVLCSSASILVFTSLFHYPTTGSKQLSYDHAWVLLASIPSGYIEADPDGLEISALRWRAISSIVPPDYFRATAYRDIDWGAPSDVRKYYLNAYSEIMAQDKVGLREFVRVNKLPVTFNQTASATPLYYYIGLPLTDRLGISVFKESLLSIPGQYVKSILSKLWRFSHEGLPLITPLHSNSLGLTFAEKAIDGSGLIEYSVEIDRAPTHMPYWNPKQIVWSPGMAFFEYLNKLVLPYWAALVTLIVCSYGIYRSKSSGVRVAGMSVALGCILFVSASFSLLGFRSKEIISLTPTIALFLGIGISSVIFLLMPRKHIGEIHSYNVETH